MLSKKKLGISKILKHSVMFAQLHAFRRT